MRNYTGVSKLIQDLCDGDAIDDRWRYSVSKQRAAYSAVLIDDDE